MFCRKCGSELKPSARFCPKCGTPAENVAQPSQAAQATPTAQAAPPAQVPYGNQPVAAPYQASPAGAATAAASSKKMIGIAALCALAAVLAVVAVLMVLNRGSIGGSSLSQSTADPVTLDYNGTTIVALHRPSFYDGVEEASLQVGTPAIESYTVEPGLSNVVNLKDVYLDDAEKALIEQYGFCVDGSAGSDEFFEVYELNRYGMQANFITVDSMMHTYHLYFAHLLKNTERSSLSSAMADLSKEMLAASQEQLKQLEGTEWEDAALRNVAFFAVGASLFDSSVEVPSQVKSVVSDEVDKIQAANNIGTSAITGGEEDYSQFKPRGYYEGDAQLEAYFRGMMWYGRTSFKQSDEDLDRSALLMTMALDGDAFGGWESIYAVTSFFAGASDDCGYYEYKPLIDAAYGEGATVDKLAGDDAAWQHYHNLTAQMPAPKINSVVVFDTGEDSDHEAEVKGYRFMGQRFTIDAAIMQNLVYNKVGKNASGDKRMMPDALDVPAALGSDEALSILEERGATGYEGYSDNLQKLRDVYTADDPALWQASLYAQWLHTLQPLLDVKGEGYPSFMQSSAWSRKNLQSYLGSYTELKHDTVLYSKQVMVEMGGGVQEKDDRGYVEPEPVVFARLAALTAATSDGLQGFGMIAAEDAENLALLRELAEQLQVIAEKELREEPLTDAEYELIRGYGGQLEHFWQEVYKDEAAGQRMTGRDFPAAVVVDVATNPDSQTVLELGTGKVSKIQVLVPVDGELRVAIGAVYSFYQFEQPMSERLTDTEWREMMGIEAIGGTTYNKPEKHVEDWTSDFQYEFSY